MKSSFAAMSLVIGLSTARTLTVKNNCAFTVWPAVFTDLNVGTAVPNTQTGWEAAAGSSVSFSIPDNWKAGRIWGRTECDFSTNPGPTSCATGGCNGGLECDPHTGTGVPPVSLAEFTLSAGGSGTTDYYDVSLVDGSNIPIKIDNSGGCPVASCPVDLNANCPATLQSKDAAGNVVGCKSDCLVDPNPGDSASCCSGSHSTPSTCPNTGVPHYSYFKSGCPDSYVYAYDESSGTALWTCTAHPDYTVTFCP